MAKARQRCWRAAWVLDLDIKSFFDSIDHELLLCAVRKHTRENWVVLYIKRWLTAPVERSDGRIQARDRGTPQGGVISPLLANLYLHYAFDLWMVRNFPTVLFARYADDVICPCRSARQARYLRDRLARRMAHCRLRLHPQKTKIVYCASSNRRQAYPVTSFDFLGYTFLRCTICCGRLMSG